MGEPLLNRNIFDMVRYARDNNISTCISTNFNTFAQGDLGALFGSKPTVLEPCLDGFTQDSYVLYRRGGNVDTVKKNIRLVMEYKRKIRSKWPLVDAQVIRFNHIVHELPQIDAFLRKLKVDKITYRQDIHFQEIMPVRQTRNGVCFWLYLGMLIRPDGRVYPCCGRGFGRFSYGNILHQSISEI